MDAISTSAASGMRARMESLEMLANNLANVETGGYKADREFFSLYTGDDAIGRSADRRYPPLFPVIESHWTDLSQGNLIATPPTLSISPSTATACSPFRRATGVRYTRNGSFRSRSDRRC